MPLTSPHTYHLLPILVNHLTLTLTCSPTLSNAHIHSSQLTSHNPQPTTTSSSQNGLTFVEHLVVYCSSCM
ncbi:hypothetical protein F4678DRAFT_450783 [Xylaria arbuscula]|nr:hypothetical protein F4678DRAFT_450783 [Xylaria arbuscula]